MGLWFGMVLLTGVFTSLYFMYGAEQMSMFQDPKIATAEIVKKCHDAAVAELRSTTTYQTAVDGGGTVTRVCEADAGATIGLATPYADGLDLPALQVQFHPGTSVGLSNVRIVITYLPASATINSIVFSEVAAQIGRRFYGDPAVGIVHNNGVSAYIESVPGLQVTVPTAIPDGVIAMVTTIST